MLRRSSLFVLLSAVFIAGCGPSNRDYEKSQKHVRELEAEVAYLQRRVAKLETDLEEANNGPARLLAQGKAAKNDRDIINALKTLVQRHPLSDEAKQAEPLLRAAESRLEATELAARKAAALKDVCRVEGKKVAPYFKGTDLDKVIKGFSTSKLKEKGEFETTASYEARLRNELVTIADPRQCVVLDTTAEYDADRKRWNVSVTSFGEYRAMGANRELQRVHEFIVENKIEQRGSYKGENAFGVSRDIERREVFRKGVRFPEQSFNKAITAIGGKADSYKLIVPIPMSPDEAKGIAKYNLKFLVEYEWTPGFVDQHTETHSPTIDEPFDSKTSTRLVIGKPTRILVINERTGDVLAPK